MFRTVCNTEFRKTMDFCVRYHVLATPLVTLSFAEREQSGFWTIHPILHHAIDERLYHFSAM